MAKEITEERARVYQMMSDIILKFILGIGAFVILCVIVARMLSVPATDAKIVYASFSGVLTGCIYLPFRHYFSGSASKPKSPGRPAKKKPESTTQP